MLVPNFIAKLLNDLRLKDRQSKLFYRLTRTLVVLNITPASLDRAPVSQFMVCFQCNGDVDMIYHEITTRESIDEAEFFDW